MALRGAALDSRPALPSRAPSARPRPARAARPVRAMASPKPGKSTAGEALDNFFQRYDVLSAGTGALACTMVFVANGQDPWTALSITAAATVTALVANELLFEEEQ